MGNFRLSKHLPLMREVAKSKILTEGEIFEKLRFCMKMAIIYSFLSLSQLR